MTARTQAKLCTLTPQIQNAEGLTPLMHFPQSKQELPFFSRLPSCQPWDWVARGCDSSLPRVALGPWGHSDVPKRRPSNPRCFDAPREDKGGPHPSKESAACKEMGPWAGRECPRGASQELGAPSLSRGALTICSLCRA